MATTEHTINDTITAILRTTRQAWRDPEVIQAEQLHRLTNSNERPDIIIAEPFVSPVALEVELLPASTVEAEAMSRLGKTLRDGRGGTILAAIALRVPKRLRDYQAEELYTQLYQAEDLEMVLFTGSQAVTRWPREGWLVGTIQDLSYLIQWGAIPPELIDQAAQVLADGIELVSNYISSLPKPTLNDMSHLLHQEFGLQTWRMAAAILVNAMVFHEMLRGSHQELAIDSTVRLADNPRPGTIVMSEEWAKILTFNYWPIFHIARQLLLCVPIKDSEPFMEKLRTAAWSLFVYYMGLSHDLMGMVFQRLIADRKFLAAFYTAPASASLLVGLTIRQDMLPDWGDVAAVKALRVADFACGTGTLLSTAYQRIDQLHELAGGSTRHLHAHMMAHVLVGCDVLPSAAHLTASMLTARYPTVKYDQSLILTVAYGKQPSGIMALGSLDLLDPQGQFEILAITAKAAEGLGERETNTWRSLPHASFDVVVMNPPFTRATVHEADRLEVPNPMFAAFGATPEQQKLMAEATKQLTKESSAHGNAGEASIFLVLADRKLKVGGCLGLVMPLSLLLGEAWENSRQLLSQNYADLIFISIIGSKDSSISFSADTDMGECLVIGRKAEKGSRRATFIMLNERPLYPIVGAAVAQQINRLMAQGNLRQLEDGPLGGTLIQLGKDFVGQIVDAPLPETGVWNLARIADISLAQAAYQLAIQQRLWLPTMPKSRIIPLPITTVGKIGQLGPIHRDINGKNPNGEARGPFDIVPLKPHTIPTYPALWAHDNKRQRTMTFEADSDAIPRRGKNSSEQAQLDRKIEQVWASASHCHFNCDFRFNSQALGMQFTPDKTIGGTAWLAITLPSVALEKALVVWANTSLGLLLRWSMSNKAQSGRGRMGKLALQNLPVLDVTALTPSQLDAAVKLFDTMCQQPLQPLHYLAQDPTRRELDERFAREVLGLNESVMRPLELIRQKLSQEPSIRGGKE